MANLRTNNLSGEQGQNAYRGSVQFNDADYLQIADSADIEIGSNDYTVEFWAIFTKVSSSTAYEEIVNKGYPFQIYRNTSNNQILLAVDSNTDTYEINTSFGTPEVGHWHHIAVSRSGNTTKGFINGIGGLSSTSNTSINDGSTAFTIGTYGASTGSYQFRGVISNVRVVIGTALYTADFTPPTEELTIVDGTAILCCQDSNDPTQEATGKTITGFGNLATAGYLETQPKVIPPYGVDAGNTFGGPIQQSSQGYMYFPTGRKEERGRGRGLIVANYIQPANYNTSEFITIQSMGNSQDFGDAAAAVRGQATFASSTRAVSGSGYVAPANVNTIEFFTIATQSNSTDFGDVTGGNGSYTPISNQTRGIFAGGYAYPAAFNAISFVTIATTGNSTDFGDMTTNRANGNRSAINSTTRGLIGGGYISPTGTNNIEFLTIATTGNSSDFGDLTSGRGNFTGLCSSTRGVFAGGTNPNNNIMDFVTIASAGNASDFGDMFTGNTGAPASTSNSIRGVIVGGDLQPSNAFTNVMQHITIATTGDSLDFGDMLTTGAYRNSTSDSHGGLS